jgi:hypothetical protein
MDTVEDNKLKVVQGSVGEEKVSAAKRAELQMQHGEIYVHEKSGIVFRQPNQVEMRFFINAVARGKADLAIAMESLARQCAVYPDAATVANIFQQKPGYPMAVVPKLQQMAGLEDDDPKL